MTESASQALSILRDPSQFEWYVVPLLVVVIYIYNVEVGKRNWNLVFAGLALWGMDWFNEIWNALVFHFTQHAPVWGAPADTAYLLLIGLNIEICMMFFILGIAAAHTLPEDKHAKIMGLPNRLVYAVGYSIFAVVIEMLHRHHPRVSLVYADYRVVYDIPSSYVELFDLRVDAGETHNLYARGSELSAMMEGYLGAYLRVAGSLRSFEFGRFKTRGPPPR